MAKINKHYVLTSVALAVIGGVSAALIGLTNLVTKDKIKQNEIEKVSRGIVTIFGDDSKIIEEKKLSDYKYVNYVYTIKDNGDNYLGYAYRTTGSNDYGKISLLVGFDYSTQVFKKMVVIVNEQTYASTLEDNYINPVNSGDRNVTDTSCGATYGAKLIEAMINEASEAVKAN